MNIVIYLYHGITALDAVGPYEILSRLPQANVQFVGTQKGVIVTDTHFLKLVADYELAEIDRADILVVPGSTVAFVRETKNQALLAWIQRIHTTTTWTTSVCTGSLILGAAGLLRGLPATSHWAARPLLAEYGAVPTAARYVIEGKIITAAGVSAGLDMALGLVGKLCGADRAQAQQLLVEYDPQPPYQSGNAERAAANTVDWSRSLLAKDARKDLTLWDVVRHAQALLKLKKAR
ncbi:DJ-1/PfpI family protein [Hymenobacter weizhouensis]|uniref:DJ-1/PfpI family protein n=1 Tax=Hymenobacter sp. YIM 151500-1 TaxID=2987689 RepID=UPI00222697D8|nr:DJ-1/PfpI family protein [Hymenobacter sp. YIM 151500-1]UYZ62275.1 DJ-1/PfpI family protein [Hymenobacter sp. YIM 151500-1]